MTLMRKTDQMTFLCYLNETRKKKLFYQKVSDVSTNQIPCEQEYLKKKNFKNQYL